MLRSSEDAATSVFHRVSSQLRTTLADIGVAFAAGVETSRNPDESIEGLIVRVQHKALRGAANDLPDSIH
jgi:hypothetical protein